VKAGFGYSWHRAEPRFDLAKNRRELNRFGWVVEIDPWDPTSVPVKLPKKPKKVPPNMRVGKVLRDARDELNWSLEEAEERSRPHYAATFSAWNG
jgi:hypothetical protein